MVVSMNLLAVCCILIVMDIDKVLQHFESVDQILAETAKQHLSLLSPIVALKTDGYLSDLCESIVSQQLSVKAASTIWSRTHAVDSGGRHRRSAGLWFVLPKSVIRKKHRTVSSRGVAPRA